MKKNITITSAIFIVLLVTLLILNNMFVTEPKRLQTSKEIKIDILKDVYKQCNAIAYQTYNNTWENNCSLKGLGENCLLPMVNVNIIENSYKENKDSCLEIYKLELNAIK